MALEKIHLRKLLKIFFLDARQFRSAVLRDIREDRDRAKARATAAESSGSDFYGPFWTAARKHVFAVEDLHDSVAFRISKNDRRRNLYPLLRDGFLLWWNQRRRWTNEPFEPGRPVGGRFPFPAIDATVKIESILSVRDGLGTERFIYPYFAPQPVLSEHAARLGLWFLTTRLSMLSPNAIRILDVIRGQTFSLDRTPLRGDEQEDFRRRYIALLTLRDELREEDD